MTDLNTFADYKELVSSIANNIVDEAMINDEVLEGSQTLEDWVQEHLFEYIDGSEYLIYSAHHSKILEFSEAEVADNGCIEPTTNIDHLAAQLAFFSLEEDVSHKIGELLESDKVLAFLDSLEGEQDA